MCLKINKLIMKGIEEYLRKCYGSTSYQDINLEKPLGKCANKLFIKLVKEFDDVKAYSNLLDIRKTYQESIKSRTTKKRKKYKK